MLILSKETQHASLGRVNHILCIDGAALNDEDTAVEEQSCACNYRSKRSLSSLIKPLFIFVHQRFQILAFQTQ